MKTKVLIILTLFMSQLILGQSINDSLLNSFYNQTLTIIFTNSPNSQPFTIIRTDFDTTMLVKNIGKHKLKYINNNYKIQDALSKPLKDNYQTTTYRIHHILVSKDTIDIKVGIILIDRATKRKVTYYSQCGRISEDATYAKFIYDKEKHIWRLVESKKNE